MGSLEKNTYHDATRFEFRNSNSAPHLVFSGSIQNMPQKHVRLAIFPGAACWVAGLLHDSLGEGIMLAGLDDFIR